MHVRWLKTDDMPDIMEIENALFKPSWTIEKFEFILKKRNVISMVVEKKTNDGHKILMGYILYRYLPKRIEILKLAVHPSLQRKGGGKFLIDHTKKTLKNNDNRNRIMVIIPDDNLNAHLFFQTQDFLATDVRPSYFGEGKDGYTFVWRR